MGLFSGGLDSILACRIVADQGIRVQALKFITPFFDHALLSQKQRYQDEIRTKFGLDVELVDLSDGYLELLHNPSHGFGRNFNPCIDCKIMMLTRARELMDRYGASFIVTGEVLGQRPMSQRRDTLNIIERDAVCKDILLRPLSAQLMKLTLPERQGWVDRDRLCAFAGRGRKPQIALARKLGITEFPAPAGGCVLTDPNLASRIERFYNEMFTIGRAAFQVNDIKLLLVGRQFRLPGGHWLVLGRNEHENEHITGLRDPDDWLMLMPERPGPTGLLRRLPPDIHGTSQERLILEQAAGLIVHYGKKIRGSVVSAEVLFDHYDRQELRKIEPLADAEFSNWIV